MKYSYLEFVYKDMTFLADVFIDPYVPARVSGPPGDCFPEEGGMVEFYSLTVGGKDAMFLLESSLCEEIESAAYEAGFERDCDYF